MTAHICLNSGAGILKLEHTVGGTVFKIIMGYVYNYIIKKPAIYKTSK